MATSFPRGSTITFSADCTDAAAAPITPSGATLYLVYTALDTGERTETSLAMTVADDNVSVDWESLVAEDGVVRWSIVATGSNRIVSDGDITLTANDANPIA